MDLALQSTCKEIILELEDEGFINASILRHDFLKRVSGLILSTGESCGGLSERLTENTQNWKTHSCHRRSLFQKLDG
jgi:hypothetical protein